MHPNQSVSRSMHLVIPFPTYSIYQSKHCVLLGNMVKQNKKRIGFSFQSHTVHNKIRRNRNQGIFMHFANFYQTNRLWLWYNIKLSLKKREKILVCVGNILLVFIMELFWGEEIWKEKWLIYTAPCQRNSGIFYRQW